EDGRRRACGHCFGELPDGVQGPVHRLPGAGEGVVLDATDASGRVQGSLPQALRALAQAGGVLPGLMLGLGRFGQIALVGPLAGLVQSPGLGLQPRLLAGQQARQPVQRPGTGGIDLPLGLALHAVHARLDVARGLAHADGRLTGLMQPHGRRRARP
ncbi:MAG TPA: hypothetical protein VEY92_03150, partial [Pseudoxanthomonas sp.]|nr:hypothetical protein [Pseudoxanthomonas sp.]